MITGERCNPAAFTGNSYRLEFVVYITTQFRTFVLKATRVQDQLWESLAVSVKTSTLHYIHPHYFQINNKAIKQHKIKTI